MQKPKYSMTFRKKPFCVKSNLFKSKYSRYMKDNVTESYIFCAAKARYLVSKTGLLLHSAVCFAYT